MMKTQDQDLEGTRAGEEAVVTRIDEEAVGGQAATDNTQAVRDTARPPDVQVEDLGKNNYKTRR
jgi:hypothetical protein